MRLVWKVLSIDYIPLKLALQIVFAFEQTRVTKHLTVIIASSEFAIIQTCVLHASLLPHVFNTLA